MMNDALCVVHPRAAGLDVHKGHITATVRFLVPSGAPQAIELSILPMFATSSWSLYMHAASSPCSDRNAAMTLSS